MKKKILFGLGAIAIAVALTFNFSIAKSSNGSGLKVSIISSANKAQANPPDYSVRQIACSYTDVSCMICDGSSHYGFKGLLHCDDWW